MPLKIAFFGATGDCAGYCLAAALADGHSCIALARTPEKLTKSLLDKGVSASAIDQHLTVVQGNGKEGESVKRALQIGGTVVDYVVSGIGGAPKLQWSLFQPVTIDDPTVCQVVGATIIHALRELNSPKRPIVVSVMTTGIPPKGKPWDVPFLFSWMYSYMLHVPHVDKRIWQNMLIEHMTKVPPVHQNIGGFVNVKASLLMDGPSCGLELVREGTEDEPAVGYTIRRSDVGLWIYERLLKNGVKREYMNKGVCITY